MRCVGKARPAILPEWAHTRCGAFRQRLGYPRHRNKAHRPTQRQEAERMTDEELYRRYLDGDEKSVDELMKRHEAGLILYITGYLHDVHEAEDLMIEAFAYLFTKRPSIRDGGLKAYLYKTARNMALRHKQNGKPISVWKCWKKNRKVKHWWRKLSRRRNNGAFCISAWSS